LSVTTVKDGIPINFGFNDFERKATELNFILSDLSHRGVKAKEINLDFNKKVVVKVRD
jgi:hypothetical protein